MVKLALMLLGSLTLVSCGGADTPPEAPRHAKNVILFLGDGMGVSTVTAARIFDGQSKGMTGEENLLSFETFPNVSLVKTYNTNQQVPDSAGTITAILTGTKTRAGVINIGPRSQRRNCDGELANPLTPISALAHDHGKAVGLVTTTRVTHATPAAVYARSSERDWEDDRYIDPADWSRGCRDIAWQLLNAPAASVDVALGGGAEGFFGADHAGKRLDPAADLVAPWLAGGVNRRYITSADELESLQPGGQVLGLFAASHLTYVAEKPAESPEPSLSEMAAAAVRLLSADEDGYFLLVEGGRIDHGHHSGRPGYALVEAQQFADAVGTVLDMVDLDETLILVTADHSHVFTMGGYATRGNPILGLVVGNDVNGEPRPGPALATDGVPYPTLGYANGARSLQSLPREAPATDIGAKPQVLLSPINDKIDGTTDNDETHGGEDVALYATGPGSDAVRGVIEQNRIYDVMVDAYGWDEPR